jgi:hypothetical protein
MALLEVAKYTPRQMCESFMRFICLNKSVNFLRSAWINKFLKNSCKLIVQIINNTNNKIIENLYPINHRVYSCRKINIAYLVANQKLLSFPSICHTCGCMPQSFGNKGASWWGTVSGQNFKGGIPFEAIYDHIKWFLVIEYINYDD